MAKLSYAQALVDALCDSLKADERVSLIGSYVLGLGPQRHLMDRVRTEFRDRVVDPPTAEAGAAATGVGAAMAGMRPFVDLGTGSFSFLAWSQITNEAAVSAYMSNGRIAAPVTFHLLHGVRGGGAAQHSHSPQSMMCNAPGLEIVAPSNPADAYGLVRAALASPNPTVIINHAKLLGLESEVVGKPEVPIGRADIKRRGRDVTIVANSLMTHYSLMAADKLAAEGIDAEVVDLRTIMPLDERTILDSVAPHRAAGGGRRMSAPLRHRLGDLRQRGGARLRHAEGADPARDPCARAGALRRPARSRDRARRGEDRRCGAAGGEEVSAADSALQRVRCSAACSTSPRRGEVARA